MTGVDESIRNSPARYQQMRELVNATCIDMQRRFLETKRSFLDVMLREIDLSDQNRMPEISVSTLPHVVDGYVLQQGKIQMAKLPHGPRVEFTMDGEEHEKAIFGQTTIKMFEQPPLETWAIFALQADEKLVRIFANTLGDSVSTFGIFSN